MAGRGHRQELGAALEDAEGHRLEQLRSPSSGAPVPCEPAASRIANRVCRIGLSCRRGFYTAGAQAPSERKSFSRWLPAVKGNGILIRPPDQALSRASPRAFNGDPPSLPLLPALALRPPRARRDRAGAGAGGGAALGAPDRVSRAQPGRHDAGARRRARSVVPGAGVIAEYLDETRGARPRRPPAACRRSPAARVEVRRLLDWFLGKFHEEVTGYLVTEKIFKRFMPPRARRRPAGHERDPRGARQCALSSAVYRLPDRGPELARGRRSDLCGSRRGGPSLLRGLSRRRAMGRGRDGEGLVRPGEIPAVVPRRCSPTGCPAWPRRATTPTWISEPARR